MAIVRASPVTSWLVFVRPFGRTITLALSAITELSAAPSETLTLLEKVSTPLIPPGAPDEVDGSAAAPTSV